MWTSFDSDPAGKAPVAIATSGNHNRCAIDGQARSHSSWYCSKFNCVRTTTKFVRNSGAQIADR